VIMEVGDIPLLLEGQALPTTSARPLIPAVPAFTWVVHTLPHCPRLSSRSRPGVRPRSGCFIPLICALIPLQRDGMSSSNSSSCCCCCRCCHCHMQTGRGGARRAATLLPLSLLSCVNWERWGETSSNEVVPTLVCLFAPLFTPVFCVFVLTAHSHLFGILICALVPVSFPSHSGPHALFVLLFAHLFGCLGLVRPGPGLF
jgi:hypothetical protein